MVKPRTAAFDARQVGLFDDGVAAALPPEPGIVATSEPVPAATQGGGPVFSTPEPTAVPLSSVLAPAVFRHPQAGREIRLQEHMVAYALKRVRRRTIGFIVGPEGLSVNAPRWVGIAEIEAGLREKGAWILRKLREHQERTQRLTEAKVDWRDGTTIPFLGETVIVVLDSRATGAVLNTAAQALPGVPRLTLHVGLPQHAAPEQIRDAVQSWLQRQARRVFEERIRHYAEQLGVTCTRLSLSSAQTRWGSASADGSIRLNWRLIHFAMPSIDYVVAHELAHLRHMDHSPRFWDVVRSVLPDFETTREQLGDGVVPVFD